MRAFASFLLAAALALAPCMADADAAAVCAGQPARDSAGPDWVLDHYVRSAAQGREWAVMVDCNHPGAPEQMRLVPGGHGVMATKFSGGQIAAAPFVPAPPVMIRSGSPVVVVNAPGASVTMNLTGVAVTSAPVGQMIRVRLEAFHALVNGVVRGPETVELVAAAQPQWGQR